MALVEVCSLLAIIALLVYYYFTKNNDYWAKKGIAFETPTPFFGNMFDALTVKRNQGQIVTDIYAKFKGEKVVGVFNFHKPALLVRDPDLINRVLVTDFHSFANNSAEIDEEVDPILGRNMFLQRGEKWKRTRQAMSPAFTVGKIKPTFQTIKLVVDKFLKWLEEHPEEEAKYSLSLFTSEIVATWGIGIDGHSFTQPDPILPKLGKMVFDPTAAMGLKFLLLSSLPTVFKMLNLKFLPDEITAFFDTMLRDLIRSREASPELRHDFLQYYIDLRKKRQVGKNDDQNDVSEDDIVAGVVSFFLEGYETSSVIASFVLFHLAKNPDIQNKLRNEVSELFKKTNDEPSLEDILNLPYLGQIFSEIVRLYGAVILSKQCTRTINMDLGNGKSIQIDEGTDILIPVFGLHLDPKYWSDPEKFDPERFSEQNKHLIPKGVYIPFGDGPRICIGMRMAHSMIKTAVVYIVRNFDIVPTEKTAEKFIQDPKHFMTTQKGGIYVKMQKRTVA